MTEKPIRKSLAKVNFARNNERTQLTQLSSHSLGAEIKHMQKFIAYAIETLDWPELLKIIKWHDTLNSAQYLKHQIKWKMVKEEYLSIERVWTLQYLYEKFQFMKWK